MYPQHTIKIQSISKLYMQVFIRGNVLKMKKFTPYIISSIKLRSWQHLEQPSKYVLLNTLTLEYILTNKMITNIINSEIKYLITNKMVMYITDIETTLKSIICSKI